MLDPIWQEFAAVLPPRPIVAPTHPSGCHRPQVPAPVQAGKRWVVERTRAWTNGLGKLRRCTKKSGRVADCYLFLAAAIVVTRRLIQRARLRYRWPGRPTTRRLT